MTILKPTSIYVAAASSEIETAARWMELCELAGWLVKSTWPALVSEVGSANPVNATLADRITWATRDAKEVAASDVLWLLMPEGDSNGAFWEFGYAHGRGIFTMVSGPGLQRSIFTASADRSESSHERGFAALARLMNCGVHK